MRVLLFNYREQEFNGRRFLVIEFKGVDDSQATMILPRILQRIGAKESWFKPDEFHVIYRTDGGSWIGFIQERNETVLTGKHALSAAMHQIIKAFSDGSKIEIGYREHVSCDNGSSGQEDEIRIQEDRRAESIWQSR